MICLTAIPFLEVDGYDYISEDSTVVTLLEKRVARSMTLTQQSSRWTESLIPLPF